MQKVNLFSVKGRKISQMSVPKVLGVSDVKDTKGSLRTLAQAIRVYEDSSHLGLAKTKTRAEVSRTKKKWYRQKGTGGARHGAKSAPIFVGGGVAHGPSGRKRILSLPLKVRQKALSIALLSKIDEGLVVFVDKLGSLAKTKEAKVLADTIFLGINKFVSSEIKDIKNDRVTFVLANGSKEKMRILRNIDNSKAVYFKDLNAHQVFFGGLIIFDNDIFVSTKSTPKSKTTIENKSAAKTKTVHSKVIRKK